MEKYISLVGYWLGLLSTALALIFRLLAAFDVAPPLIGLPSGNAIAYVSFLHGAVLFFLLAIASWCRTPRS